MLSFESNAVLAVVVTQTPRHAFASHTGVMGEGFVDELLLLVLLLLLLVFADVPSSFLVQAMMIVAIEQISINRMPFFICT